jgi:toxin ParE1/3/4
MATMNISIPDGMKAFVEEQAAKQGFGTVSEYIESTDAFLAGLRFLPITKFPTYLLFYRPLDDGIELIRVLHGARDIARLLEFEEEEPDS